MKIPFFKTKKETSTEAELPAEELQDIRSIEEATEQQPASDSLDQSEARARQTGAAMAVGMSLVVAAAIIAVVLGNVLPEHSRKIAFPQDNVLSQGVVTEKAPFHLSDTSITTENVQRVVESLSRPEAYTAAVTNTLYWNGTWATITADQYVRDGITLIAYHNTEGIEERYEAERDGLYYAWRRDGSSQYSASAGSIDRDDMSMIPTYETVVELDQDKITDAGMRTVNGEACIFVTVMDEKDSYQLTYWISTVSGLLIQADYTRDGELARSVAVGDIREEIPSATRYVLPDGTTLLPDSMVMPESDQTEESAE